jgi:hypothetical protein
MAPSLPVRARYMAERYGPPPAKRPHLPGAAASSAIHPRAQLGRGVNRFAAGTLVPASISTAICVHTARHSIAARSLSMQ